ncbi:MAG: hypothetical protein A2044_02785 [Candidatus Firestonebacteria bacterium GWA2_43_8]|nr:MAG: hypothetical protein A2044_02785 [Candidatus Firestonebacteria bacterium GWA2_43_8]
MKSFEAVIKSVFVLLVVSVFVFGADKKTDKKESKEPAGDAGVLYEASFEDEDDIDAFVTDFGEVEWKKEGANKSKGCMKVFNPGESAWISCEKSVQWNDSKTVIDFDYFLNGCGTGDFYVMASGTKGKKVRGYIKSAVKGKWGHAQVKVAYMQYQGVSGKGDTFKNILFVADGVDKESKDPHMLIDNIVIKAGGASKKEE